jgi:hypothetical protein
MNKLIKASIRKLSDVSTELLRSGESDLTLEVQRMIVRLFEIQDQLTKKESSNTQSTSMKEE